MTSNQITFLGTGTSTGIPMIGCPCQVCHSSDERDKRMRQSIYLTTKQHRHILVDTSPDMRSQFLRSNLTKLDFCFITHDHADHLHGIDDVRPFCFGPPSKDIDIVIFEAHRQILETRFSYIFQRQKIFNEKNPYLGGGLPLLNLHIISPGTQTLYGEQFTLFELPHGHGITMGIYHEGMAYVVDCQEIPPAAMTILKGNTNVLIIDCLQRAPHQTHLNVTKAFEYIREIAPKRAYLTHMNHDLSHVDFTKMAKDQFGASVTPACDMQQVLY
ncbi:MAG: MBL fold metallo-hydrolase [Bdellovibrio sp.]|nr:MBL fold metallo-hydrolase [Bdellovibrio sp.]